MTPARRITALALALAAPLPLVAPAAAEAPVRVVATIGMIADVAAEVGGACAAVETLMGPGIDPHLYQASASDVGRLQGADAILYAGFGLEGQLGAVLDRLGATRPTLAVGPAAVPTDRLIPVQDLYGIDPHIWMDPGLWALTAPVIAEFLAELAPACAEAPARADGYVEKLEALDRWVADAIATIPEGKRYLVTAHDAFAYYARAYDLEEVAIQGISTEAEASVADIRDTASLVAEIGVPAVFVETTINPRTMQAVVEAARQRGHALAVGGELYSDAMGEDGTSAGSYIGMIHANTRAITESLGGTLPPLPTALAGWAAEWDLPSE